MLVIILADSFLMLFSLFASAQPIACDTAVDE
jgi:hypothetical protein